MPALFLIGLRTIGPSVTWPVERFRDLYRGPIPLAPAAGILIWVIWASSEAGSPDPLPYVPILNPLELVQTFGLIAAFVSVRAWGQTPGAGSDSRRWGLIPVAVIAFAAINTMVGRIVHFYWGISFDADSLLGSSVFQAGISIVWGVTAGVLMTLARMRINRAVWMMGAGVLAALIVKLFLVDLGNVGGVARIVSFLATGLLILAIGYFAPAPPKTERAV
jgi:uncharacterized membrane protein